MRVHFPLSPRFRSRPDSDLVTGMLCENQTHGVKPFTKRRIEGYRFKFDGLHRHCRWDRGRGGNRPATNNVDRQLFNGNCSENTL